MKKSKFYYLFLILFIIAMLFLYKYMVKDTHSRSINEMKEYPLLDKKFNYTIKGVIVSKFMSFTRKGCWLVKLSNGNKLTIGDATPNFDYTPSNLYNFIQVRDSIYKPIDSDSLFIYRNGREYYWSYFRPDVNAELKRSLGL